MGWSCTLKVGDVLREIFDLEEEDGLIHHNGERLLCEASEKEYDDERILMNVIKIIGEVKDERYRGIEIGRFYIKPDGSISKGAYKKYPFLKRIEGA